MAAGLNPLDDHSVGTGGMSGPGLSDRAALVDPGTGRLPLRGAPEGDDDVGRGRGLEPIATGEGKQQVDGDRPARQRPRSRQLALDRGGAVDRDRPQPAGLRDRRRKLVAAESPAHPGLYNGCDHAKPLKERHDSDRSWACLS